MQFNDNQPELHIFIQQTLDNHIYKVRVTDPKQKKTIFEQQLTYKPDNLQAQYVSHMLESARNKKESMQEKLEEIGRYGQRLFRNLFGSGKEVFEYIRQNAQFAAGVRFVLRFDHSAADLWNLPWEYIHTGKKFLFADGQNVLIRTPNLDPLTKRELPDKSQLPQPLRILVIASSPEDLPQLNVDLELSLIRQGVQELQAKNLAVVDYVDDGSLSTAVQQMKTADYHIIHYTGHGGVFKGQSFLAFENGSDVRPVFVQDLLPIFRELTPNLRLFMLSGCQTGQVEGIWSSNSLAVGLLHVSPAVVAMQFSILDDSATVFTKAFYEALGRGLSLESSITTARLAMQKRAHGLVPDWGIPSLYLRTRNMRLADPEAEALEEFSASGLQLEPLPRPAVFVGRKNELKLLRSTLNDINIHSAYIWGIAGVGKSSLARQLLERPGTKSKIENVFIVSCPQTDGAGLFSQLADWLESQNLTEPASYLRQNKGSYADRLVNAGRVFRETPFIFVFENFEAWLGEQKGQWHIKDPVLAEICRTIVMLPWRTVALFTSRYYWSFLNEVERKHYREIQLQSLPLEEAMMLSHALPNLAKASLPQRAELLQRVGGHPYTLYQLDVHLAKHTIEEALKQKNLEALITSNLKTEFLEELLAQISSRELAALQAVSVLDGEFWEEHLRLITGLDTPQQAMQILGRLEALSLIQYAHTDAEGDVWYKHQPLVQKAILSQMDMRRKVQIHGRAADMASRYFLNLTRQEYAQKGRRLNPQDEFEAAGWVVRAGAEHFDPRISIGTMEQALIWRKHLYEARQFEQAAVIIKHIWPTLKRWNYLDRAKELLVESIKTTKGVIQAEAKLYISQILVGEGHVEAATELCEEVYTFFDKENAPLPKADALSLQALVHLQRGETWRAEKKQTTALEIYRQQNYARGIAQGLANLARIQFKQGKMEQAAKYNQQAAKVAHQVQDVNLLTNIWLEHARLLVQNNMLGPSIEFFNLSLQIAQQMQNVQAISDVLSEMSQILWKIKKFKEAKEYLLDSIKYAQQIDEPLMLAPKLVQMATFYLEEKNYEEAEVIANRALKLYQENGSNKEINETQKLIKQIQQKSAGK